MLILSEIYYILKMIISSGNELDWCEIRLWEYQLDWNKYLDPDWSEDPLRDPWILWQKVYYWRALNSFEYKEIEKCKNNLIESLIIGRNFCPFTWKKVLQKLRFLNIEKGLQIEIPESSELARTIRRDFPGHSKDIFGTLIKMFEHRWWELVFVVDNSLKMKGFEKET